MGQLDRLAAALCAHPLRVRVPGGARVHAIPQPVVACVLLATLLGGMLLGSAVTGDARATRDLNVALAAPSAVAAAPVAAPPPVPAAPPVPEPPAPAPAAPARAAAPNDGSTADETVDPSLEGEPDDATTPAAVIKRVVVVALTGQSFEALFGETSAAAYLARELRPQGLLLTEHRAVAPSALAGAIALLSGQEPRPEHVAGCPVFTTACAFDAGTPTLTSLLDAQGTRWRSYTEGLPVPCARPEPGAPDLLGGRAPLTYFEVVRASPECGQQVLGLDRLLPDLASARTAPAFAYVTPDPCHDGSGPPCAPGAPAGVAAADAWLRGLIPDVLTSAAMRDGGLLVVTATAGAPGDATQRVGALVVGPGIEASASDDTRTDHFALTRLVADLLALEPPGRAADAPSLIDAFRLK